MLGEIDRIGFGLAFVPLSDLRAPFLWKSTPSRVRLNILLISSIPPIILRDQAPACLMVATSRTRSAVERVGYIAGLGALRSG
jgi:hypothetical protein